MSERESPLQARPQPPRGAPPDGYRWVAVADEGWEIVNDDRHMKCRQPKCPNEGIVILWRPRYSRYRKTPWRYCPDHMYGRWIEDGRVMAWILEKEGEDE